MKVILALSGWENACSSGYHTKGQQDKVELSKITSFDESIDSFSFAQEDEEAPQFDSGRTSEE